MQNFPKITDMTRGYNYTLQKGQPYKSWNNGNRVVAASRVINGECAKKVANEVGCCVQSVKNWVKTLETNNPRLEG